MQSPTSTVTLLPASSSGEPGCCGRVELQRDESLDAMPEPAGGRPGPRPKLQHLVAKVYGGDQGRQHVGLQVLRPVSARAQDRVVLVHLDDATAG